MFNRANVYVSFMIAAGAAILGYGLWDWHTEDFTRFLFCCAIALLASGMKVTLPGVRGTMSMNFLFVLIGIAELSRSETLLMGCLGMLVQCVFHAKERPKTVQVLFSIASMACSISAGYSVYHAPFAKTGSVEAPGMLLLAAAAFFIANTCFVAVVIGLTEGKNVWAVWRESYFWTFPNYLVGAAVGWMITESSRRLGWQTSLLLLPILYVIYRSHGLYVSRLEAEKKRAEERRVHAEEVAALHRRTIKTLALAIEAKDQTTGDHLARVEVYAIEVGKELGLNDGELEALRAAALLHDIGKLAVPEYIISKPGKLTPAEFEKMKIHTVVGAEILEQVQFPYAVAPIVRSHHEKWDGSGYPDGLAAEQIPLGSRILSAVDCLDALASDRQYRTALPLDEAIAMVQNEAGKSFDPRVVAVLARRFVELERRARTLGHAESIKLSSEVKIERGGAPAAGFETAPITDHHNRDLLSFHNSIHEAGSPARALADLANRLEQCQDRPSVFALLRTELRQLIPYDLMLVYGVRGDHLEPESLDGEDQGCFSSLKIPVGMGLSGWVAENAKSILNGNPSVEAGYLDDPASFSILRSALAVPLETDGAVKGVLSLYRHEGDAFTREHLSIVLSLSAGLARALYSSAPMRQGPVDRKIG